MYVCVYLYGQLHLNEWINLSCMREINGRIGQHFLHFYLGVVLMVRDSSGHHVARSMSFFFSLSLPSLFSFVLTSLSFVTLYCVHRTEYFFHSFALTTIYFSMYICWECCSLDVCTQIENIDKRGKKINAEFRMPTLVYYQSFPRLPLFPRSFLVIVNAKWLLRVSWFFPLSLSTLTITRLCHFSYGKNPWKYVRRNYKILRWDVW